MASSKLETVIPTKVDDSLRESSSAWSDLVFLSDLTGAGPRNIE